MRAVVIVCLAVLALVLLVLLSRKSSPSSPEGMRHLLPRKVWLLWLDGWDAAPDLVKRVRDSWKLHNPTWDIVSLDEKSLGKYGIAPPRDMSPQAASDVIRLHLMAEHGGVWADATMACMYPLDGWIDDAVSPAGFWMYHGRDEGRGPASWFMASVPGSIIARKWVAAADAYWKKPHAFDYFWMDALFADLVKTDPEFAASWDRVPYVWCEDPLSAHALAGKTSSTDPDLMKALRSKPPYVIKLSHKDPYEVGNNNWEAIRIATETRRPLKFQGT